MYACIYMYIKVSVMRHCSPEEQGWSRADANDRRDEFKQTSGWGADVAVSNVPQTLE